MLAGLSFDEAAHAYAWHGKIVPSVTQALARLCDYGDIPPHILAAAAARGKAVHRAIELEILNDLDESDLHPEVSARLAHFRRFCRATDFKPIATEFQVYSRRYEYAGTLDLYGRMRGMACVIDIKATAALPPHVGPQLAAYAQALRETIRCGPVRRGALHLERGRYQFVPYTSPLDLPTFLRELANLKTEIAA